MGNTTLTRAIAVKEKEIVQLLLQTEGIDVNMADKGTFQSEAKAFIKFFNLKTQNN